MGDLRLFEARGIFDHLNCQHTREFDQKFSKKSNALGFSRGGGGDMDGIGIDGTVTSQDTYFVEVKLSRRVNSGCTLAKGLH